MGSGQKSAMDRSKRKAKNYSEEEKESHRITRKKYYENNKDKVLKLNKEYRQHNKDGAACEIIKQHHEDMKDDPERLTTEFMKSIVNIECDD